MTTFIFEMKDTKGVKRKIHMKRKPSGKCDVFIKPTTQKKTKSVRKGTKHNSNNTLNSNSLNNS
jgi:hypothetical protein